MVEQNENMQADGTDENHTIRGFMCLVDWQHHAGFDSSGNKIYWDEKSIRHNRKCVKQCGIIEVEIKAVRIVSPQKLTGLDNDEKSD